jgi:hypothetical protein
MRPVAFSAHAETTVRDRTVAITAARFIVIANLLMCENRILCCLNNNRYYSEDGAPVCPKLLKGLSEFKTK